MSFRCLNKNQIRVYTDPEEISFKLFPYYSNQLFLQGQLLPLQIPESQGEYNSLGISNLQKDLITQVKYLALRSPKSDLKCSL